MAEVSGSPPAREEASRPRRRDGFRERGAQVTRVEAFIDAAFAFAVTLLVISFDRVPGNLPELISALKGVPAFGASFALVALFWHAHHVWSRRTGLDDAVSVLLGLLLVFLVLVWVYPLRILFLSAFAWISEIALPEELRIPWSEFRVRGYADILTMFRIYGVAWSSLGFVISALYAHAWRRRGALDLDLEEQVRVRGEIATWLWVPVTGAVSIATTYAIPDPPPGWAAGAPGLVYFLMFFSGSVGRIAERQARRRLAPAVP